MARESVLCLCVQGTFTDGGKFVLGNGVISFDFQFYEIGFNGFWVKNMCETDLLDVFHDVEL